ncbi:mycothiol system anti-sigma-R factor [Actinobaculum suis]|uniref:Mycothiol system anti-sigma-R factor n=1 Tax=Actinobaculum suis TaxID=1657 RepID=A0A1B9BCW6_9ACTO|nr:mycothiol system anti-sigma-R factor [Actinobaculum suis]MDY5152967.1 mycothiol system anti-sigma-R factor [Actinobaculum suis]OCA94613.1 mycothiol system anti-sigma-R factor [Actinobaculum suis]OCA94925.1 mycothiol system anti-sigma-R factor [Actinobaculum suis]SDE37120.1 mycothiol system anti-sigma-R factor [Actinobaculum suis]VDG77083.1 Predicted transmembrane transcriptional regulator (anti-sigma factor) [Actinobaculum suis]
MSSGEIWARWEVQARDVAATSAAEDCTCEELVDHLFEYLDHQVPREQEERLDRHIAGCEDCQDRAQAENHVRQVLKKSCATAAPATLRTRITQQISIFRRMTH